MVKQADNDFKATTGIYDASLGEKGPDESGKALLARQKQTDIAILNFSDNLSRTLVKVYRHIVKWIQKGYSEKKLLRIIKPDNSVEMVHVNDAEMAEGVKKVYDLRVGSYDVVVTVGPSYQTKRQESVATQLELAKSMPVVAQAAPDLMIRNLDIPQADEIADRVKMILPPAILQNLNQDQNTVPQLHAQLQHATQQIDLLSKVNQELLSKAQGKEAELQAKMQIEQLKNQTDMSKAELDAYVKIAVAEITAKTQSTQVRAELEQDELQQIRGNAHDLAMSAVDKMHERQMADKQHQQALEQGQQDTQNQATLAEQSQQHALEQGEQSGQQQQELQAQAAQTQGANQ